MSESAAITARPGIVIYIMVADIAAATRAVTGAGGKIILAADSEAPVVFAHFQDPAGNIMGMYQARGISEGEPLDRGER